MDLSGDPLTPSHREKANESRSSILCSDAYDRDMPFGPGGLELNYRGQQSTQLVPLRRALRNNGDRLWQRTSQWDVRHWHLDATRGVPGLVGTAAQFGNQSTVFLSAPDLTGDWSAEFLVERTGTKSSSVLIRGIPFAFPSGALKLEQYPGTEQIGYTKYGIVDATFSPGASAPLNQWVDIIYVNQAAADRVSLFVNGVLVGTRIDHFSLSRDQIGSWSDTVPESPLAIMDEAIIYSRALSPGEVASHFAAIPEPTAIACVGIAAIVMPLRCRFRRFNDGGNCNAINCAERWHALR